MRKTERVNAVEMTRAIRDRQYRLLRDRSPEERRRYYEEQARRLHEQLLAGSRATGAEASNHES